MKIKSADLEIHFNSKDAKNILKTQQIVSFTLQMRQKKSRNISKSPQNNLKTNQKINPKNAD